MSIRGKEAASLGGARKKPRELCRHDGEAARGRKEREAESAQRYHARDGARSGHVGALVRSVACGVANLRHCAPRDALPVDAEATAAVCHRVEPRVGRRVGRLAWRPHQSRDRRVHVEVLEHRGRRDGVQRLGAVHLGPEGRSEVGNLLVAEHGIRELVRRMEHALEAQPASHKAAHGSRHAAFV